VAEETELTEGAKAPEVGEDIEEERQAAAAAEAAEVNEVQEAEAREAVEAAEEAEPPAAEEEPVEELEIPEAPSAEEIEAAEETVPVEEMAAEPESTEPLEAVAEVPDLMDEISRGPDFYYYGTGRRKTATAQVRLHPSKEPAILVNDKRVEEYFSRPTDVLHLKRPLQVTATEDMFRITAKVQGGGLSGQAGAIRHGIARALTKANPELRRTLRREGSLTRDPRMKERKKPGLKRARKAPQYTKR
jgi:small subunit ribosomal protein S9